MRHQELLLLLLLLCIISGPSSCLQSDSGGHLPYGSSLQPVIDGAESPEDLGFPLSRFECNAALGMLYSIMGSDYQGCSGTLVGDRVVVSAGHCVMENINDWVSGADPVLIPTDEMTFVTGEDIREPLCRFEIESVHLHPEVGLGDDGIDHDFSIAILSESALDTCPEIVPIQIAREPLTREQLNESVLIGGYGSTDGSYNFSPIRYWALMDIIQQTENHLVMVSRLQGESTKGDSGAGSLLRFPDGVLRNVGICSTGGDGLHEFVAVASQTEFFDEVVDHSALCGAYDEIGSCRENAVVRCDERGFMLEDCEELGLECVVDDQPRCACPCDLEPYCEGGCECDPQCPCECDDGPECSEGCDCDPHCYGDEDDARPDADADADSDSDSDADEAQDEDAGNSEGPSLSSGGGSCSVNPVEVVSRALSFLALALF